MVEEVRERVIRAAAYRPFEGGKRVFVVEAAEAMRDESQNALLKTLEEPPEFVHLILLSSEPEALLETIASRCQPVDFAPLPAEVLEAELGRRRGGRRRRRRRSPPPRGSPPATSSGPGCCSATRGRELRAEAERCVAAALAGEVAVGALEGACSTAPRRPARTPKRRPARRSRRKRRPGIKRTARDIADEAKRAGRRRRTEILDLGLELCAAWLRDLAAIAAGAEEVVFNRDRLDRLRSQAAGLDPPRARRAAELVQETRRRLDLNVSEELALEALLLPTRATLLAVLSLPFRAPVAPACCAAPFPAPAPGPGG